MGKARSLGGLTDAWEGESLCRAVTEAATQQLPPPPQGIVVRGKGSIMSPHGSSSLLLFLVYVISPSEHSLNFLETPLGGLLICSQFKPLLHLMGPAL